MRLGFVGSVLAIGFFGSVSLAQEAVGQEAAARGRLVFGQCRSCHELVPSPSPAPGDSPGSNLNDITLAGPILGGPILGGPILYRIFGRVAGKMPDFANYSATFKTADFVWTPRLLARWLADPLRLYPDTTMMSAAIADPQQRADLIAYLRRATVADTELTSP